MVRQKLDFRGFDALEIHTLAKNFGLANQPHLEIQELINKLDNPRATRYVMA
jgi:hypothetical protein